ncbi:hypothetical protein GUITHDRAFT_116331 [Guillardia theta CCMP2712]|uniref:Uncharacterized protein n=1 Tax=Guillardia theta (strain CCMP2712) TaxID=905079 RepID=L1IN51_GUITC|nr:hypothetical protein GUITHDRAFT_116331 [Guillardia theta CCMP2712]EKX37522.1 hypothetical protein GUITHDRAFT_116331 [Guillardia theta CCMP2712]|eukprot:XP_005824502.1 hypothetical protein GUITHDRAFT_116331 [Guillardia theta CCMP2712]
MTGTRTFRDVKSNQPVEGFSKMDGQGDLVEKTRIRYRRWKQNQPDSQGGHWYEAQDLARFASNQEDYNAELRSLLAVREQSSQRGMLEFAMIVSDCVRDLKADVTKVQVELTIMEGGGGVMQYKQAIMMEKAIELDKEEMFAMRKKKIEELMDYWSEREAFRLEKLESQKEELLKQKKEAIAELKKKQQAKFKGSRILQMWGKNFEAALQVRSQLTAMEAQERAQFDARIEKEMKVQANKVEADNEKFEMIRLRDNAIEDAERQYEVQMKQVECSKRHKAAKAKQEAETAMMNSQQHVASKSDVDHVKKASKPNRQTRKGVIISNLSETLAAERERKEQEEDRRSQGVVVQGLQAQERMLDLLVVSSIHCGEINSRQETGDKRLEQLPPVSADRFSSQTSISKNTFKISHSTFWRDEKSSAIRAEDLSSQPSRLNNSREELEMIARRSELESLGLLSGGDGKGVGVKRDEDNRVVSAVVIRHPMETDSQYNLRKKIRSNKERDTFSKKNEVQTSGRLRTKKTSLSQKPADADGFADFQEARQFKATSPAGLRLRREAPEAPPSSGSSRHLNDFGEVDMLIVDAISLLPVKLVDLLLSSWEREGLFTSDDIESKKKMLKDARRAQVSYNMQHK